MHEKSSGREWTDPWTAERAIVLQVLREDKDPRWTLAELQAEAYDIDPTTLAGALSRLERHGIVVECGEGVVASRCALHLDALGMVSI
jgi:DNA-binding IclR family transcriptional regulator